MPRDLYTTFGDGDDITANAGAGTQSANVWDLDQAAGKEWKYKFDGTSTRTPDPWTGGNGPIEVKVSTALAAAVDGCVLTIYLYEHTAATSIESGNIIAQSPAITINSAATGATAVGTVLWRFYIPQDKITERYVGLYYAIATQNLSAGAVDAALLAGAEKQVP